MYAYIRGKLTERNPAYAVIETNGVGYLLHISLNTYSRISEKEACLLYTHQVIREDAHLLFGFADEEERELFRHLISVSGVGPNTAMMLLSSMSVNDLRNAITGAEVSLLKTVKGIGEKSAQRIIVDLKNKLEKTDSGLTKINLTHNRFREEALSGLIMLGFQKKAAEQAVDRVIKSHSGDQKTDGGESTLSVEMMIREALKIL